MVGFKIIACTLLVALGGVQGKPQDWHRNSQHQRSHHFDSNIQPHPDTYGVSRQFAHFAGPVSGAETQIVVPRGHYANQAGTSFDFVAKPDYKFGFGVEDTKTGNKQQHTESRDGDIVRGEYSLLEPDGTMRIVQYTADPKHGFQAVVKRAGHAPEVFGAPAAPKPQPPPQQHNNYDDEDY